MKMWLRIYVIVKVLLWKCDDNEFVNTSIVCVWRYFMGLMGRFYGRVNLVYVLEYGFK